MQTRPRRAAEATAAPTPDDALIGQSEARRLAGNISDMTLWRWRQAGVIPEPLSIRRRNYWRRGEFLRALELAGAADREAARMTAPNERARTGTEV